MISPWFFASEASLIAGLHLTPGVYRANACSERSLQQAVSKQDRRPATGSRHFHTTALAPHRGALETRPVFLPKGNLLNTRELPLLSTVLERAHFHPSLLRQACPGGRGGRKIWVQALAFPTSQLFTSGKGLSRHNPFLPEQGK